ncbi:MAG: DUF3786 domain-containing protein [Desulfatibacillaceae bacterium]|nr:DUF3786 domain-containing protein [Desulfatibacillaceae bacterium]
MTDNYTKIMLQNLDRLFMQLPQNLDQRMGAQRVCNDWAFNAFGRPCRIHPHGIDLGGGPVGGPVGVILSLYALHAKDAPLVLDPPAAFRQMPDSAPYVGAFRTHTETLLAPFTPEIEKAADLLFNSLCGMEPPTSLGASADLTFVVRPLPKIALCYQCYMPDEDFPASVTCLYSNNAHLFLPTDALADVGEYTSRRILELIGAIGEQ